MIDLTRKKNIIAQNCFMWEFAENRLSMCLYDFNKGY